MKIIPTLPTHAVRPAAEAEARAPERAAERPSKGTQVSLSDEAKWISAVKDETRRESVRPDVVARHKEMISNGTLDQKVDLDQVVDRLLADL